VPSFRTGFVTEIVSERPGLQRVTVDGEPAYVLTELIGSVAVGDRVVMNTTAVELGLGTGGWHVVHWNLEREGWRAPGRGRVLKLRYTSLQVDTGAAEERETVEGVDLAGRPVVAGWLHSQVACVAAAFGQLAPGRRLVYVMTDGGALPIATSDLVAGLREAGLLAATITCGQAFGGDAEAVNVHSALGVAVRAGADAIVVATGPGVVGTGGGLGFSGMEVARVLDAAAAVGGTAIASVRYSDADPRPRHAGVSHHTRAALARTVARVLVAIPRGEPDPGLDGHEVVEVDVPDVPGLLAARGLRVTSMGRGPEDDPRFYAYAGAAGALAATLVG
jgi:hypothetical protein